MDKYILNEKKMRLKDSFGMYILYRDTKINKSVY